MPPRLLLDGEDLRTLMLRVRDEMGPDARIVKAERVRTGGIAGFFARERYELTVEIPDPPAPTRRRLPRRSGAPSPAPAPAGIAPDDAAGIDALLAAADRAERADQDAAGGPTDGRAAAQEARVSTTGDSFADVLQSVQQMVQEPHEVPPAAPGTADQGTTDQAARPTRDDTAPTDPATDVPTADVPQPDDAAWQPEGDRPGSSVTALLELGIPARLLAGFSDPTAPLPLSQLVRRFERPPGVRLDPGTVLAVVGEPQAALRTAGQMAHRAGLAQRDIVLAGDMEAVPGHGRRLQTPSAAERYRARVSEDALYVVVVGVPAERERWAEAAAFLEALAPHQAWAVVDARRKAVDLRRWMRVVGARRPFDALAASSTFDAQAPGTVLNLGTPVGWVDGLPATSVVWAAVLSERLADDARWD